MSSVASEQQVTLASDNTHDDCADVSEAQVLTQMRVYVTLQDDIQCRYSLACNRLESLLALVEQPREGATHTHYLLLKKKADEDARITQAYNECVALRQQLNVAQQAIARLQAALVTPVTSSSHKDGSDVPRLQNASTDRLRVLCELLLDSLINLTLPTSTVAVPSQSVFGCVNAVMCEDIFRFLCVHGSKRMLIIAGLFIVRTCADQPWWGRFLGNMLQTYFSSEQPHIFPQDK